MTDRDNMLPPNPRQDVAADSATIHSQSSDPVWKTTKWLILLGAIACPVAMLSTNTTFLLVVGMGVLSSVAAFAALGIGLWRSVSRRTTSTSGSTTRTRAGGFFVAISLLVFYGWSCTRVTAGIGQRVLTTIAQANLAGIAHAARLYREQYQQPAPDIDTLIAVNLITPKMAISPNDRDSWLTFDTPSFKSSFVFIPGAAIDHAPANSTLAYERDPWSSERVQLFPKPHHLAVRIDGSTIFLTPSELAAALHPPSTSKPRE